MQWSHTAKSNVGLRRDVKNKEGLSWCTHRGHYAPKRVNNSFTFISEDLKILGKSVHQRSRIIRYNNLIHERVNIQFSNYATTF